MALFCHVANLKTADNRGGKIHDHDKKQNRWGDVSASTQRAARKSEAKPGRIYDDDSGRAVIRLIENQLKEARVGEYTIQCDEAKSRKGGGKAPSPLQYFVAATGF
jgi:hypothetical protein